MSRLLIDENKLFRIELFENIPPQENRKIQSIFFNFIDKYIEIIGSKFIRMDYLMNSFNFLPESSLLDLNNYIYEFLKCLEKNYNLKFEIITDKDNKIIKIPDFQWISQNSFFLKEIENIIKNIFNFQIPTLHNEKIELLESKLKNFQDNFSIEYLSTNPIDDKMQISEKIGYMIQNSKNFLYFSLPFYDTEINFLFQLIHEKLKNESMQKNRIDFRIFYSDNDQVKNFIRILETNIKSLEYFRFYKKFSIKYLKKEFKKDYKRYGNLHSKMIISELGVLIGSANITINSLNLNYETALFTNNKNIINNAKTEFEKIWDAFDVPLSI